MPEHIQPLPPEGKKKEEFPTYRRGAWWPAFSLLLLPFLFLFKPFYSVARKELNGRAALATILCFETFMLFAEHYSLKRGHWVYNEARIWGPKVFGVPLEEPLLYYWFPGLFVIVFMLFVKHKIEGRKNS
ncbi:MAG TPA: hypothetical protein P5079_04325 [Elusimicrobiota bacterium]|nr:hypothetical protein [Elusimicrobiota bacterium]